MKLLTAKLTFDGKKDANFLFNTCVRSFVTFFFFLSFRRGKKYNRSGKSSGSNLCFFLEKRIRIFLKIERRGFRNTTRYRRNNRFCEKISISSLLEEDWKKKKNLTCPLAHFLQGQYDCHVTGNDRQNWDDQAEDEEESYIGLALGYGIVELPGHAARHVPRLRPVTSPSEQWRQREA